MPTRRKSRAEYVRKDGKVSRHEQLIRSLIDSDLNVHRNGFADALRTLSDALGDDPPDIPALRPDAYRIDHANCIIECYEVEVTCALGADRLAAYASFWFDWDCRDEHEWLPRLIVVDRFGHRNAVDLCELYLAGLYDRRIEALRVSSPLVQS